VSSNLAAPTTFADIFGLFLPNIDLCYLGFSILNSQATW
jgi:hypothetical protein